MRVRIFADRLPESALFSVSSGKYEIKTGGGKPLIVLKGEPVLITRYSGKLALKTRNSKGVVCDSVTFTGKTGDDSFSLRINGKVPLRKYYSGDFQCFPDLETIVMINTCDVEQYVAGVVRAEGGSGRNEEYFKTQAVIARTYMYKYFRKHISDRYNLCDDTHCQAFNGLSSDTIIDRAALETKGLVILDKDSTLIISAFHSNCGGETASSEDVWLTSQQYLKNVFDPYCLSSHSSRWEKKITLKEWIGYLRKSGFKGSSDSLSFSVFQDSRVTDYRVGSFSVPLRTIRTDMNLRSTYFSVVQAGDTIILKGRGYGHGVGLCQEGAMIMATKGFSYQKIIDFYYPGVIISDIKSAVVLTRTLPLIPPLAGLKVADY